MQVLAILREKAKIPFRSQVEPYNYFFANGLASCDEACMIRFRAEIVPTHPNGTTLLFVGDSEGLYDVAPELRHRLLNMALCSALRGPPVQM